MPDCGCFYLLAKEITIAVLMISSIGNSILPPLLGITTIMAAQSSSRRHPDIVR